MKWTKSQEVLRQLALQTPERPFHTEIVLCDALSGISRCAQALTRETAGTNDVRVVGCFATGVWEAISNLCDLAGVTDINPVKAKKVLMRDALKRLAGGRPVCVLLEESHQMKAEEMELLITAMECGAREAGVRTRACLLCNRVSRWIRSTQTRENVWPRMPIRFVGEPAQIEEGRVIKPAVKARCSSSVVLFTREGLEELRKSEIPESLFGMQEAA